MKPIHLILLVTLSALIGCESKEKEVLTVIKPVKIMSVHNSNELLTLSTPGSVRASKMADLSFDVSGRIVVLNAVEGSEVNKGDIIAELDSRDFENKYQSAKANLKEAAATFDRYKSLIKSKSIDKSRVDLAEKNYDVAKSNMALAKKSLEDTKLRAYFSGIISSRDVENFQNVQAKQIVVSIEDKTSLDIVTYISEITVARNTVQDIVSVQAVFPALPNKTFDLKFKEASQKINNATKTYAVVFSMIKPDGFNLRSGMTADVTISVKRKAAAGDVIRVPVTAVFGGGEGNSYVWIYNSDGEESGSVSRKKVDIGRVSGSDIHILSGLETGDVIVVAGVNYLVEGMRVRPLHTEFGDAS